MFHEKPLCESCQKNTASVYVSRIAFGKTTKQRLCEECAYRQGSGKDWLQAFEKQVGEISPDTAKQSAEFEETPPGAFEGDGKTGGEDESKTAWSGNELNAAEIAEVLAENLNLPADELDDLLSEMESMLDEALGDGADEGAGGDVEFSETAFPPAELLPLPGVLSARCSKCGTTWDRLREDGRAGCTQCYESFEEKLLEVMGRMQREPRHVGKAPRAALRRRRRLEQLRMQRDHRLEMLQRRLQEAVAAENYEDAAALRDKIKMVESTIVKDEG